MECDMVHITGLGVVSSVGNNITEFGEALRRGIIGVKKANRVASYTTISSAAEIPVFSFQSLLNRYKKHPEIIRKALVAGRRASISMQATILSVLEAWDRANFVMPEASPKERVGIIIAGHNLSTDLAFEYYSKYKESPEHINPRYAIQFMDSDYLGTLSEIFDLHGQGFTLGGASSSSNTALIKGYENIKAGYLDICFIVSPPANLGPLELQAFYNSGAMAGKFFKDFPEEASRPFDQAAEGFVYGEGCGCLILESERMLRLRGVESQAEILGGAIFLDGNRMLNPSEKGEAHAMQLALKYAELKPTDIEYINTHGTSSPLGDKTEINAMKAVYGQTLKRIWLNATKGLIGHCIYSAGVMEAIATIVQMNEGFLHPNMNLNDQIDSECLFCGEREEIVSVSMAMSNSFGFGGINSSIILRK